MVLVFLIMVFLATMGLGIWFLNQYRLGVNSLSNRKVIEIAKVNGGKLTVEEICDTAGVTKGEARIKLYTMLAQGIFEYDYDNLTLQEVFTFSSSTKKQLNHEDIPHRPNTATKQKLSDGEIISLAVRSKGRISSASLCMKADIPVDEAKERLNDLHEKGVFEIQVTENGTVTYLINDIDLLEGN